MDVKITLSFGRQIINQVKQFANDNGISLSRLTEFIYKQMTTYNYKTLEDLPISNWVNMVAEDVPEYRKHHSRKGLKSEFHRSKSP